MYERMLQKQVVPTLAEMAEHCTENAERFSKIQDWLTTTFHTEQKVVFPYGNRYGWGLGHYRKKKLFCNIFPEAGAFTVMLRLTNAQCEAVFHQLKENTQKLVEDKYPCGDGGWIHYRVHTREDYEEVQKLIEAKCL